MNNTNKKVVISQPMNSLRLEAILKNREKAVEFFDLNGIEVIDTVFDGSIMSDNYIHESLYYLARAIDAIGKADAVYFMPGWEEARGCVIEHYVCKQYNVPIFYELPSSIEFYNKIYLKGNVNEDD